MKKVLLKGGTVVNADGVCAADVLIEGERIAAVAPQLHCPQAETVDVSGRLLFPGFIDAHTHFDLDVCNTTTADDFSSGSQAALLGGTTMILDFACPNKGETLQYGLDLWHRKADGRCACDYGFHMTIDDWNADIRAELPHMLAQGISSFKMYTTYPAMMLDDADLFRALRSMKELGCLAGVHCENAGVIDALIEESREAGFLSPAAHPRCRPAALEAEAIARLLKIASLVDVPVMIVHLSSEAGLREIRAARAQGQRVYVETCPHYLLLDDALYSLPDFEGARYVCAPPLRHRADQEALWEALRSGEIQTISTDHCSFTLAQKAAGRDDFTRIPGGMPGVETRGVLLYTYGVTAGRITAEQMTALLSANPAKLYGLWPRKGKIAAGSDADLVVYDPHGESRISAATQHANVDYSPYEGYSLAGQIDQVWLRGTQAVRAGRLCVENGGIFIPRRPGCL